MPYDNITKYYLVNITGIGERNKNPGNSDDDIKILNLEPDFNFNQQSKNSDVFSSNSFEFVIPNKVSNTDPELSDLNEFNITEKAGNKSILQNNTYSSLYPSIIEIEPNQSFNKLNSTYNEYGILADAGRDQIADEGTTVILNGSNSIIHDGVILSYLWRQIPNPNISIGGANTKIWSFIAPHVSTDTTFTFELTITDNRGISSTDNVNISVKNRNNLLDEKKMSNELIADAGRDQIVEEGSLVTLEGKFLSVIPNDNVSFQWVQSRNLINFSNSLVWSFRDPYVESNIVMPFHLIVTDDHGDKATDLINVLVKNNDLESEKGKMFIQTLLDKNPISKGEKQIIKIDLFDTNSNNKITNAKIKGQIIDASNKIVKRFSMNDDSVKVTLKIAKNAKVGNYIVRVNAYAPEYISADFDTNFKVQK